MMARSLKSVRPIKSRTVPTLWSADLSTPQPKGSARGKNMAISSEQKVGLFFLAAIVLLGLTIEFVEDWRPFEERYAYHSYFQSAVGLKVSDPVRMAGVEVGKVEKIGIEDQRVRVDFYINQTGQLHVDSIARIRQTNLLGGSFLGLDFGSVEGPLLAPGSEVSNAETSNIDELITSFDRNQQRVLGSLGEMVDDAQDPLVDSISRLERVMVRIESGEGTLGQLVNNPDLYQKVTSVVSRLDQLLQEINDGQGSLGRLLRDPSLYDNLDQTVGDIAELTAQVRQGEGSLGRLLNDERMYVEAEQTLSALREVVARINRGEGSLGKLYRNELLYDNLTEAAAHINQIAEKINAGQGTLGKLVNEQDVYLDAKATLHKVEKAVDGLRDTGPLSALGVVVGTLF
ncbi:MAG: MCE family protein [Desulfuromonas sp.]|nr:MAG: MCE family protein [Desulfuromonas sp.]